MIRLLYFLVFVLFAALLIQLTQWKRTVETETKLAQGENGHVKAAHQKWIERVAEREEKQGRLEKQLLWVNPDALLPELGKISDRLSLSLVGVEELREWHRGDFGALPIQLTLSGNYNGFTTFLSVVERIVPMVRIEEVRLYRRKRRADTFRMSLTLAPMHKRDRGEWRVMSGEQFLDSPLSTSHSPLLEMPAIRRISAKRNPFAFDATAPQSNTAEIPVTETPLPQLTGILWDELNPIAIFGAQSARVGDVIAGATILAIGPQQVIVMRDTQQHKLKLWKMKVLESGE